MDKVELLPCPFCGADDNGCSWVDNDAPFATVACYNCGANIERGGVHHDRKRLEAEAIAAWNTRAALRPPEGEVVEAVARTLAAREGTHPDTKLSDGGPAWEIYAAPAKTILTALEPHIQARVDAERERCAKVVDAFPNFTDEPYTNPAREPDDEDDIGWPEQHGYIRRFTKPETIAAAIRALGEKPDAVEQDKLAQAALRCAIGHIRHMAAWIGKQKSGYSFESLGEDMPGIEAALEK